MPVSGWHRAARGMDETAIDRNAQHKHAGRQGDALRSAPDALQDDRHGVVAERSRREFQFDLVGDDVPLGSAVHIADRHDCGVARIFLSTDDGLQLNDELNSQEISYQLYCFGLRLEPSQQSQALERLLPHRQQVPLRHVSMYRDKRPRVRNTAP